MSTLLLGMKLHGRRVLVVGGGHVAEAKIESLLDTGAELILVAPSMSERLRELCDAGALRWRPRLFRRWDPWRCALVIAAVNDAAVNRRVVHWSHRFGALVNVVDDPASCDVIVPAVVKRGLLRVAISTDGASPAGARFLREELDRWLPRDVGALLEHAAHARRELRDQGRYRYDYAAWRQRFFEPGMASLRAGHEPALGEIGRRFLATFDSTTSLRPGRVTLVGAGPGGADLITVRGAAALAAADIVVYDRLVDPALLDLAPVAAKRIPVGKAEGHGTGQTRIKDLLIEHARAGAHVVRLKGGDPFLFGPGREELEAVRGEGICVEVVPGLTSALAGPALAATTGTDAAANLIANGRPADEPVAAV